MDPEEIGHRFNFHPATTAEKQGEHTSIRAACMAAAHRINETAPDGREKSLAITKLEEAMMWGNAAIARANPGGG